MKNNKHEEYKENVCSIFFTVILTIIFFFMLITQLVTNFVDDLF